MAAIDRDQLLSDIKEELGEANILTDSRILLIAESVISIVGDDDIYYPEVFCKTLRNAATLNRQRALTGLGRGVKKEESYERVIEWFEGSDPVSYWDEFLKTVGDVCILYGYTGLTSSSGVGFYANVSPKIKVPDCDDISEVLGFELSDES